ncbi:hypothetical protein [Thiomicrorhabdus indica]|nr:hypothetical protein [Thiomicrorhabdus indica]
MGDLNNDWVLWGSIGALVLSIVALLGFGYKAFRGMEGMEDKEDEQK